MSMPGDPASRLARAWRSLEGLSVGDGFGDRFFALPGHCRAERISPAPPWPITDDSIMAIRLVDILREHGGIDQDALAARLAAAFVRDPERGYGGTARKILSAVARGAAWHPTALAAFRGIGSCGNGSAMRVAPLGAYFADDLPQLSVQAARSAEVTHAHPEGIAGAIVVALAAGLLARGEAADFANFLTRLEAGTPAGETRDGLRRARMLGPGASVASAAEALGNGSDVTCQRTVPFCAWMVARQPSSFEDAMWETVSAGGDLDTNCAIVGGILAAGEADPPADWRAAREELDAFWPPPGPQTGV